MHHNELAAQHRHVSIIVIGNPTQLAEAMVLLAPVTWPSIATHCLITGQKPEIAGVYRRCLSHPLLPAEGAVALASTDIEIDVSLKGDCSAVAASVEGLLQEALRYDTTGTVMVTDERKVENNRLFPMNQGTKSCWILTDCLFSQLEAGQSFG